MAPKAGGVTINVLRMLNAFALTYLMDLVIQGVWGAWDVGRSENIYMTKEAVYLRINNLEIWFIYFFTWKFLLSTHSPCTLFSPQVFFNLKHLKRE